MSQMHAESQNSHTEQEQPNQIDGLRVDKDKSNSNIEHLASDVQNVSLEQSEVVDQNVNDYISMLKVSLNTLNSATEKGVRAQLRNLETIENATKKLSALNSMTLENAITEVASAIEVRQKLLAQNSITQNPYLQAQAENKSKDVTMAPIEASTQFIQYSYLYKFIQDMSNQTLKDTAGQLNMKARQQLTTYNQQGLIEKSVRNNNPKLPLHRIFLKPNKVRQQLTRDQCTYLLQRIAPEDNSNESVKHLPFFNPDFHFPWTIMQVDHKYPIWNGFTDVHKASQLAMDSNKNLSIDQIEAKFAFEMQCRWIRIALDVKMNVDMNERMCYVMANDRPIRRDDNRPNARALLPRDGNTGAWDGHYIYYYIDDVNVFMFVFNRMKNFLSPLLTSGDFIIEIIGPTPKNSQIKSLPFKIELPPPHKYELILPISNSWLSLVKSQLVDNLQERFTPVLGFGSVYIPTFSNKEYGVNGRHIHQMARFQNDISQIDENELYNWDINTGTWQIRDSNNILPIDLMQYTSHQPLNEDNQMALHEQHKVFTQQKCDIEYPRVYGSNHYWTMWNRDQRYTQISKTPMTIYGEFTSGFNPFQPCIKDDPKISHLLLAHCQGLNEAQKTLVFRRYIDQECQNSMEMASRYRRIQQIMGFKAPNLCWSKPSGTQLSYRIPTLIEFLQMKLPQTSTDFMRQTSIQKYFWLPKPVAAHVDDITDTYFKSKKELNQLRFSRLEPPTQEGFIPSSNSSQRSSFNGKRKFKRTKK